MDVSTWQAQPGIADAIAHLNHHGWHVVQAVNQPGLGRGSLEIAELTAVQQRLQKILNAAGGRIEAFFFCPTLPKSTATAASPPLACCCKLPPAAGSPPRAVGGRPVPSTHPGRAGRGGQGGLGHARPLFAHRLHALRRKPVAALRQLDDAGPRPWPLIDPCGWPDHYHCPALAHFLPTSAPPCCFCVLFCTPCGW